MRFVFPNVRGSGINQTKAALYIHNGYISVPHGYRQVPALGAGHRERPLAWPGRSVAPDRRRRRVAHQPPLRPVTARLRIFAPIGAAAGLAAAFNAPISAILFVIEEVIGSGARPSSAPSSSPPSPASLLRAGSGEPEPMFRIPTVNLADPRELLAYAVLGIAGGFASLALRQVPRLSAPCTAQPARMVAASPARRRRPPRWRHRLSSAYPGDGSGLRGHRPGHALAVRLEDAAALALFKIIATTLSFSSGTPGRHVRPYAVHRRDAGRRCRLLRETSSSLHLTGSLGSYALVGMGVLFAAFLRAPLTSVFMVLEVSGNYSIVLPVILANTIAYLISRGLQPSRSSKS